MANEFLDTKTSTLEVIFDNGGGVYLQTAEYSHHYQDGRQLAEDVRAILSGSDPMDWDGNDNDERIDYSDLDYNTQRLYTHYNLYDLQRAMDSKDELKTSGYTETDFLRTLTGRKHIDD
jgi:hypothetical protein